MREKVAWVTDSTGFLDEELQRNEHLHVVPVQLHVEGKDYLDSINITNEEMFQAMSEREAVVTTSQPSVGQFQQLYERLENEGYERIYAFLLSGQLSGTVSSSEQAAQLVNIPVYTFDTMLLSYPLTYIMKKAMALFEKGYSPNEILEQAAVFRDSNEAYVLIGSLDQLHKSGRLSSVKYYIGSFLKIKPIIAVVKGKLEIPDIARNELHAEKVIFAKLKVAVENYDISDCMILYGRFRQQADKWIEKIEQLYPDLRLHVYPLGTAIGVHVGGNTLGISWFKEKV
ncbi:MAG: DegV family protein [Bacillus sp. (in: firmicutes)]